MFFTVCLIVSLAVCLVGCVIRIGSWFKTSIGSDQATVSASQRLRGAAKGLLGAVFSRRVIGLAGALVLDVLLLRRSFRESRIQWLMHMCLFYGFGLLVLMHALDQQITRRLFPDYASTLFPFIFFRNLFGALVLTGLAIAMYRRSRVKRMRGLSRRSDWTALVILIVIICSGFALESVQITSASIFHQMVADYLGSPDESEMKALKAYWAKDFGVVFSHSTTPVEDADLEAGVRLHQESCAACHSKPVSAFISYPISRVIRPAAGFLDGLRTDLWLWYLHFLACFVGLAYLPFGKFFHLLSVPINLLVKGVADSKASNPATASVRLALGLDACTNCGVCSRHCRVAPINRVVPNPMILPSEKLHGVKEIALAGGSDPRAQEGLSEGSFICTECLRCTEVCPSGIDLQSLWLASRRDLIFKGFPEPHVWVRQRPAEDWADRLLKEPAAAAAADAARLRVRLIDQVEKLSACVQCTTCTSVCPVVAAVGGGLGDLDFTPQQVLNLIRLDLIEQALGARMVWDCVTCYICQENCPQGIKVADIFYELRNTAWSRFRPLRRRAG